MKSAPHILLNGARTFIEKRKVYGSSYVTHGRAMASLFPKGITLETPSDFLRFSIYNLIVIKMGRYAQSWDKRHQDSVHDAMVYAAVLEEIDQFTTYEELEAIQDRISAITFEEICEGDGK
jgi:hypothetical protein